MVTLYRLNYNENPYKLAKRIARKGTVQVCSHLVRLHEEEINEDTVFELFDGRKMKLNDFMEEFLRDG